MAKGDRAKNQLVPPVGIKSTDWSSKKNSGSSLSKNKPGVFSVSCNEPGCEWVQNSTKDRSLKCGPNKPRVCPNGHVYPVNGYVNRVFDYENNLDD